MRSNENASVNLFPKAVGQTSLPEKPVSETPQASWVSAFFVD